MLERERDRERERERERGVRKATGSKTAALVSEFAVEDLPSAELQPRFLRLQ